MKFLRVRQKLVSNPIADVRAAVREQLDGLRLKVPQGDVGITAGSRGIANIAAITRAAGDWLREHGARPFLFPAMGSHNGGTAEGQRAMIESLGLTEAAMGMPIRASMDVVKLGTVSTGDVWMDRHAYESAGVLVLNRIKLHTCFSGPVQSGLTKMMVVGMGKTPSATTFHSAPTPQMKDMLLEMGQVVLDSGKIWAGLAILEDGYDQTAELHAVRPADILQREPRARRAPSRTTSRACRSTTSTCWSSTRSAKPTAAPAWTRTSSATAASATARTSRSRVIHQIAALSLSPASHGNAIGVGLADFITRRLRDAIDEQKTFLNSFTTGHMGRVKIPVAFQRRRGAVRNNRRPLRRRTAGSSFPTRCTSKRCTRAQICARVARGESDVRNRSRSGRTTFNGGRHDFAFNRRMNRIATPDSGRSQRR